LSNDGNPALVAIYQVSTKDQANLQFLTYSFDFGKTWTKYSENPVSLDTGNASYKISKITWHEESQKWILVLTGRDHVRFYSSDNLIDWQFNSTFSEVLDYISGEWDYSDFFPLIAEGSNETKWVLMVSYNSGNPSSGAGTRSIIGDFNGFTFQPVHEKIKSVDYGKDNFAGVTCNLNNDCYHIGCINNSTEADQSFKSKANNSFTLPRKLSLSRNFNGYIITSTPVEKINQLRAKKKLIAGTDLKGAIAVKEKQTLPYEINLTFNTNKLQWLNFAEKFGVELSSDNGNKMIVAYNHIKRVFYIDRLFSGTNNQTERPMETDYAPFIANGETLEFRIIIDHNSIELFSGNGSVVMSERISQDMIFNRVKIFAEGGEITLKEAAIYRLKID
jgi:fructan beta-fructosidase